MECVLACVWGEGRRWQHGLLLNAVPSALLHLVHPSSYQAPSPICPLSPAILDRVSGAHNTHSLHSLLPTQGKVTKAQGTEHGRKNTIGPKKKKKDTQNLSKENISHAP